MSGLLLSSLDSRNVYSFVSKEDSVSSVFPPLPLDPRPSPTDGVPRSLKRGGFSNTTDPSKYSSSLRSSGTVSFYTPTPSYSLGEGTKEGRREGGGREERREGGN